MSWTYFYLFFNYKGKIHHPLWVTLWISGLNDVAKCKKIVIYEYKNIGQHICTRG